MIKKKEKIKILVAADRFIPEYAGWINQLKLMLDNGYKSNLKFTLYTSLIDGEEKITGNDKYNIKYCPVTFKKNAITKFLFGICFFAEAFKKRSDFNLVMFPHGYHPFPLVAIFCYLFGIDYIVRISGLELVTKNRFSLWLRKIALKLSNFIVVLNKKEAIRLEKIGIKESNIIFLPNGVDNKKYQSVSTIEKEQMRKKYLSNEDEPIFINVGNISKRKGVDKIIKSFYKFRKKNNAGTLIIVGPVIEEKIYNRITKSIHYDSVKDHIKLTGKVDNVLPYLQISDVFILASESEGMPNALLEALAVGLPIIANNIPGVTELSEMGYSICLYEGGHEELLEKMNEVNWKEHEPKTIDNIYISKILRNYRILFENYV